MRDEMDARFWVEHGQRFSEDLGRLIDGLRTTFSRMTAIQFRAPWRGTGFGRP